MEILDRLSKATEEAIYAASNGCDARKEIEELKPLQSELRSYMESLLKRPDPVKGARRHAANASAKRSSQRFLLSFRGGGEDIVIGWARIAKRLRLAESSIGVMLSRGKGKFEIMRFNALIDSVDVLTVARIDEHGEITKPKRGRPRTRPITEDEYNIALDID